MKTTVLAAALVAAATSSLAAPAKYTMDPSHSQVAFSYTHAGFSTTYWLLSGFEGEVMFDSEDPAASSVTTSIAVSEMLTGWDDRYAHIMKSGEFFNLDQHPTVTFTSTGIEVTGDDTAKITGDLSLNGVTKSVVLDAKMNANAPYPFPPFDGKPAIGVNATATILRSDFDLGLFAPFVADEVALEISIEAMQLE